jgi:hypothetical protein
MKFPFAWLALGIGLLSAMVLLGSGATRSDGEYALPLLTLLIVSEFAFIVTAIGAVTGVRTLIGQRFQPGVLFAVAGCSALAVGFLWLIIRIWPGGFPA